MNEYKSIVTKSIGEKTSKILKKVISSLQEQGHGGKLTFDLAIKNLSNNDVAYLMATPRGMYKILYTFVEVYNESYNNHSGGQHDN